MRLRTRPGDFGRVAVRIGALVLCVSLTSGCPGRDEGADALSGEEGDDSPVVARVGDHPITTLDLRSYVSDKAIASRQRISEEDLRQLLDGRVVEEALYREALRQGLHRDPEIRRDIRQMLANRFINDTLDREVWSKEIPEAELQEYYDEHHTEFNRPEQVRVADIFVAVPADAGDEERSEARSEAEAILAEALESRETRFGFGTLIRERSDTPEKYQKGDTGFFDAEGAPVGVARELVEAAFALERVGSVAGRVIEAPDGYHVIMLTGRRSGVHIPLENVREQITQRMRREAAAQARTALIDGLKADAEIQVDDEALGDLLAQWNRRADAERAGAGGAGTPPPRGGLEPPALPGTR